ncbi:MAG: ABC transporter substrate-binding protein [Candidatus Polarisedimenticolia bacterium]
MPVLSRWRGAAVAVVLLVPQATLTRQGVSPPLLLVSGSTSAYMEAERGAMEALESTHPSVTFSRVNLNEAGGDHKARRLLLEEPSLVVAVGSRAAQMAREISPNSSMIYALVLDPGSIGLPAPGQASAGRITGVAMDVTLAQQFAVMRDLLPSARRVGVLYDPSLSGDVVRRAREQLKSMGLELKGQPVRSEAEVLEAATLLAPDVDVLWAIPDTTVLTPVNARALILLALRSRKPLLAMSEGYVANGALAAVSAHPYEVGRRAGEMAGKVLDGASLGTLRPEMPPRTSVFVNLATAQRLGITIPSDLLSRADGVYPRPASNPPTSH